MTDRQIIELLNEEKKLSMCIRRKVSCFLITRNGEIVKGHNGSVGNHCKNRCIRDYLKINSGTCHSICYGIHAEVEMVKNCLISGYDIRDAQVFSMYSPCSDCAQLLEKMRIKSFTYLYPYPDRRVIDIFNNAGIELKCIGNAVKV